MRRTDPSRSAARRLQTALGLTVAGLALGGCSATVSVPVPVEPPPTGLAVASAPREMAARPAAVAIPAIGVRAPVDPSGIAPDGSAEVPEDFQRVGWFTGGGRPGSRGPTVLLGHVDSRSGPSVFYRLRDLRPGDLIEVITDGGGTARYAVGRTEQVAKDEFPTFAVFGAVAGDVLRLVTCAGDFDRSARSYTDNLIVHAVRL